MAWCLSGTKPLPEPILMCYQSPKIGNHFVTADDQSRDQSVNVLSQWEATLHCNISHWLGAYRKWSLPNALWYRGCQNWHNIRFCCHYIILLDYDTFDFVMWKTDKACTICVTLWFNSSPPIAAYRHQWIASVLVQIMACRLFSAKPLSKPMLGYCQLDF